MAKSQLIGQKEVGARSGVIIIALSLAALYLLSLLFTTISSLGVSPLVTSIGFWLSGGGIAVLVFKRYVIRYLYTIDDAKLVIARVYSKKPRFMEQILLREIIFAGAPEEAQKKNPGIKSQKAIRKTCAIPVMQVVYKRAGEKRSLLLQPNEEISALLQNAAKQ